MTTTSHHIIVRRRLVAGSIAVVAVASLTWAVVARGNPPAQKVAARATAAASTPRPDLADLKVNELGRIPVMEWHDVDSEDSRWATSRTTFLAQLDRLYKDGYRPITVADLIAGRIDVEAGKTPFVLTFDDSFKSHLYFGSNGKPHPDSVVGMLEQFASTHPGFKATAAFYVFWPAPFREADQISDKLKYLKNHGFEIGNHSMGHDNLSTLDDEAVQSSLGGLQTKVQEILPKYRLDSLALPYGSWPKNRALAVTGQTSDTRYWHKVIFLVGDMPAISPFDERWDPTKVMRVQSYEFTKWMDWLDADPTRRFVSDGDPATVVYPDSSKQTVRKVARVREVRYPAS